MPSEPRRPALPLPAPPPLAVPDDLAPRLAALGVTLTPEATARVADYLARLLAMNEQVNLTAVTDPGEVWTRHALDSLSLVPYLADLPAGARVLDLGSGGGVPGILLAIARPDLAVTLVEATEKKATFLVAVSAAIGLDNVTVVADRAEALVRSDLANRFDVVTARAVARIGSLVPWTAPFARHGGRLLLIKGERAPEELAEARKVLGRHHCVHVETVQTPTGRIVILKVRGN